MIARSSLFTRVILTVSYSAQFGFPLTIEEIWRRIITATPVSFETVSNATRQLVSLGILKLQDPYIFLTTFPLDVKVRKSREENSRMKTVEIEEFITLAKKIPWIQAIALTGSTAVYNAKHDDDVDFMIVTASNTLWLTRLCVIVIALYKKKRRSWGKEEKNSWCFNLWLEEDALRLPDRLKTIYGAYELCQARWVFERNTAVIQNYFKQNRWAQQFLYNYFASNYSSQNQHVSSTSNSIVISILNSCSYFLQKLYMIPHLTSEQVGRKVAFFHPRDTKKLVYTRWREILQTL